MSTSLEGHTARLARIEQALADRLPDGLSDAPELVRAMRYSVLGGGKRIRALLLLLVGELLEVEESALVAAACAVEFIHSYSLIHDDLPAMDDDDLRRGKPSLHRAFDEATAILAGDALQALAFDSIASAACLSSDIRITQTRRLAHAAGAPGMVGGQVLDMAAEAAPVDHRQLELIHRRKTGALLEASVLLAADARPALPGSQQQNLKVFAGALGLAYQVRDDLLDLSSDTRTLGKPQGSDRQQDKATFPSLMGEAEAARYCETLHTQAEKALDGVSGSTAALRELSGLLLQRQF